MINKGLFSSFFIERIRDKVSLDDLAKGRMATLTQTWKTCNRTNTDTLWNTFLKQSLSYLQFVPANTPLSPGVYKLFEDWGFFNFISVVYLIRPDADIDDTAIGRFWPAKLLLRLKEFDLNWGILTDGSKWRLYSAKSSRPYEDYVELELAKSLGRSDEKEYGLFESFFHKDSFIPKIEDKPKQKYGNESASTLLKCQLDQYRKDSEEALDEYLKKPLLYQIDEVLQYLCNGFIFDTPRKGEEYTEEERKEIFENSVKLLYRCLFLFYGEARKLLPSEAEKSDVYEKHSLESLCYKAHKFQWGKRTDTDGYDLWMQFKGLINAVNEGDPEYGIMGYNGGLFDDTKERFLGKHRLRNDFFSRALYLLSYVEPRDRDPDKEYKISYEDLEVRHLGELYENILEYTVLLADADRIRRRTKKGVDIILASETVKQKGDTLIQKGDVYFGESALERKQTGSYYTPEPIVQFLNKKTVVEPLREKFKGEYRSRFEEFLEQANSGYDDITKRGASRSALALIKRFVDEVILEFKVCDPAMGSGHFLVDFANQMAGLIVGILAEIPEVESTTNDITGNPNYWRRLITRFCLYGVDLNPLAVDLAKLSLWLNCFAINHKLTFLDHHLRCGNSLIGIHSLEQLKTIPIKNNDARKKSKQRLLPSFDNLIEIFNQSATAIEFIKSIDEDNLDLQKDIYKNSYELSKTNLVPLADLYTTYILNNNIQREDYIQLFYALSGENKIPYNSVPQSKEITPLIREYKDRHRFFHWPLEFPDLFTMDKDDGFNATIGNPPWDIIMPKSQEFFSKYDPNFRKYRKQEAIQKAEKLMEGNPLIKKNWEEYINSIKEQSTYFRELQVYTFLGKGSVNTFKLFLERFYVLLIDKGRIGIVVPSSLYTDQGCQALRMMFIDSSNIKFLYCFENRWPTVFNGVDGRFKFILFGAQKGGKTEQFKCAFMEHDPDRLDQIDAKSLAISLDLIEKLSPKTFSVFEFQSQTQIDIAKKIYGKFKLIGDYSDKKVWNIDFHREFHMTDDSDIFNIEKNGLPLIEGKNIWQFDSNFSEIQYFIDEHLGRKRLLRNKNDENQKLDYQNYRIVYRKVAANTNERTLISSIIPKNCFTGENLTTGKNTFDESILLFSCGLLNSFCEDFIIRLRITTAINIYHVHQIPLPRLNYLDVIFQSIIARVARLVCLKSEYSELWRGSFNEKWSDPLFWYPTSNGENSNYFYGPLNERDLRKYIYETSENLSSNWETSFGAYEKSHDRRDIGTRAQFRAEIDAYVTHLYGLTRDEFSYILDTFPVLKRKEEAVFGEYMSKRKCLEEYDRIASIL